MGVTGGSRGCCVALHRTHRTVRVIRPPGSCNSRGICAGRKGVPARGACCCAATIGAARKSVARTNRKTPGAYVPRRAAKLPGIGPVKLGGARCYNREGVYKCIALEPPSALRCSPHARPWNRVRSIALNDGADGHPSCVPDQSIACGGPRKDALAFQICLKDGFSGTTRLAIAALTGRDTDR